MKILALVSIIALFVGVAVAQTFTERLFSEDAMVSLNAMNEVRDLPEASKKQLNDILLPLFNSKNKKYRTTAISAAARAGIYSLETVDALIKSLKTDAYSPARLNAAEALSNAKLKDNDGVKGALLFAMTDKNEDKGVRQTAARSLLLLGAGKESVCSFYREALLDPVPEIRSWTISAISERKETREALEKELIKALSDENRMVRYNAVLAVAKIDTMNKEILEALRKAVKDNDKDVREAAKKALKNPDKTK